MNILNYCFIFSFLDLEKLKSNPSGSHNLDLQHGIRAQSTGMPDRASRKHGSLTKPKSDALGNLASKLPKPPSLLKHPKKRGGNLPDTSKALSQKRSNQRVSSLTGTELRNLEIPTS